MFLISIPFFKIKTDTSRIKLLRLIIRIKNEWLKDTMFKKSYEKVTDYCLVLPFYTPTKRRIWLVFWWYKNSALESNGLKNIV